MPDVVPIEPTRPVEVSLPGNTDKAKEGASPEKKVIAKAKVQKKSAIKEALRTFFVRDLPEIAEHLVIDVAIPAAKNAITDMVTQGIQQLLYGEVDPRRRQATRHIPGPLATTVVELTTNRVEPNGVNLVSRNPRMWRTSYSTLAVMLLM